MVGSFFQRAFQNPSSVMQLSKVGDQYAGKTLNASANTLGAVTKSAMMGNSLMSATLLAASAATTGAGLAQAGQDTRPKVSATAMKATVALASQSAPQAKAILPGPSPSGSQA